MVLVGRLFLDFKSEKKINTKYKFFVSLVISRLQFCLRYEKTRIILYLYMYTIIYNYGCML